MTRNIAANDSSYADEIQRQRAQLSQGLVRYHSIELPDGAILPGLQDIAHLKHRMSLFPIPEDLRGKRVLDIGAWDGWFSFEMERRGAEVVAVDVMALRTFLEARELLGLRVDYRILDLDEIEPEKLGRFDIVLFFGVLYHLRNPLLGLEKVLSLTSDLALIESLVISPDAQAAARHRSYMEFYETTELGGQLDNWFGPTPDCLLALCRAAGFAQVTFLKEENQRASVICGRRLPPPPPDPPQPAPWLNTVTNNRNFASYFHPRKEEYLLCFFESESPSLTKEDVLVEVAGYGTPVLLLVQDAPQSWRATCMKPPDLRPGTHVVKLRTPQSGFSNEIAIIVLEPDEQTISPLSANGPEDIEAPDLVHVDHVAIHDLRFEDYGCLYCYFYSKQPDLSFQNVAVELDGKPCEVRALVNKRDYWQANVSLPKGIADGTHSVRLRTSRSPFSKPQEVLIQG